MTILDGKAYAENSRDELRRFITDETREHDRKPKLVIISVGDDPASQVYVRNKEKACAEVGIECEVIRFSADVKQSALINEIDYQNHNACTDGIILQLPLPKRFMAEPIIERIAPEKDVDYLTEKNLGKLYHMKFSSSIPCTPHAVMALLWHYRIPTRGKHVVILGRSNLVGRPLAVIMSSRIVESTVTLCHSQSENLEAICRQADILISAVGKPRFVTADMVKPDAVVIDVGINRDENGKLCGDVDFEKVAPLASYITPVPGGIGPVTVTQLLWNTFNAYLTRMNDV